MSSVRPTTLIVVLQIPIVVAAVAEAQTDLHQFRSWLDRRSEFMIAVERAVNERAPRAVTMAEEAVENDRRLVELTQSVNRGSKDGLKLLFDSIGILGRAYWTQYQFKAATKIMRERVTIGRQVWGLFNWEVVSAHVEHKSVEAVTKLTAEQYKLYVEADELAATADKLKGDNPTAALEPSRRVVEIRRDILGAKNGLTFDGLIFHASLLDQLQHHDEEAVAWFAETVEMSAGIYGKGHPVHAATLYNLGDIREKRHELKEAQKLFRRALAIQEGSYGKDHPDCVQTRKRLAALRPDEER